MLCKVLLEASLALPSSSCTSGIRISNTLAVGDLHQNLYPSNVYLAQIPTNALEGSGHTFKVNALSCARDMYKADSEAVAKSWPRADRGQTHWLDQDCMPPGVALPESPAARRMRALPQEAVLHNDACVDV